MKRWPQFILLLLATAVFGYAEEFVPGKQKAAVAAQNGLRVDAKRHRPRECGGQVFREFTLAKRHEWIIVSP